MTKSRPPGPADLPLLGSVFPWLRDQPRFLLETYRRYGEVVRFEFLGFHGRSCTERKPTATSSSTP